MRNTTKNFIHGNRYEWNDPFTIVIDTRNTEEGGSAANEFLFPQNPDILPTYIDFLVDWGDGQFSRINSKAEAIVPHVYAIPGIYTLNFYKPKTKPNVVISPRYEEPFLYESHKLLKVLRWGKFNNSRYCFLSCINLNLSEVIGSPLFNGNGEGNFRQCQGLTTINNLSNITFASSVSRLFEGCINFDQEFTLNATISTTIASFLKGCIKLNNRITINAPRVTSATNAFENCVALNVLPVFHTPLLSVVTGMFSGCTAFNQDVSNMLDWSKITNMDKFMAGKSPANYNASYYDNLLIALDNAGRSNVPLGMGSIKCTSAGVVARSNLLSKGWTITDGMI